MDIRVQFSAGQRRAQGLDQLEVRRRGARVLGAVLPSPVAGGTGAVRRCGFAGLVVLVHPRVELDLGPPCVFVAVI